MFVTAMERVSKVEPPFFRSRYNPKQAFIIADAINGGIRRFARFNTKIFEEVERLSEMTNPLIMKNISTLK